MTHPLPGLMQNKQLGFHFFISILGVLQYSWLDRPGKAWCTITDP